MRVVSKEQKYLDEVFGLKDLELAMVRERMVKAQKESISISGAEARILQFLVRGFGIRKIVEFGTLFGYSALAMAKVLPADGKIITFEKDPQHFGWAAETFKDSTEACKIVSLCGDAADLMRSIEDQGPFDLVFIDADKAGYVTYLNWAEKNLRKGGLIVGDNTFLWGAFWGEPQRANIGNTQIQAMSEFNTRLANTTKYNSTLFPTAEGLTVAQKL